MNPDIIVRESSSEVSRWAAELFAELAQGAVAAHGRFTVALSGGSTPKATYTLLAAEPFRSRIPWEKTHIFWGDERCVPPDHEDSNYRMANEALLSKVNIPSANIHRMRGEDKDVDPAARAYEQTIREVFGLKAGELPRFDFVMLGMGDDGHTLSLFPGTTALSETDRLVVSNWVEKFNTFRITTTAPVVNNAASVAFLAPGKSKAARLKEVIEGPRDTNRLPSQLIQPTGGELRWIIDREAAALLK
ncbi:MAG TPA: 6-phosphogluconolactonase [Armatimonadota bacterium]|nr:6-phosphogluconolactonase [Armatimonadota bacterium]